MYTHAKAVSKDSRQDWKANKRSEVCVFSCGGTPMMSGWEGRLLTIGLTERRLERGLNKCGTDVLYPYFVRTDAGFTEDTVPRAATPKIRPRRGAK